MSDDVRDKALEQAHKCPICEGSKVPSVPENYIVLGIVTRDIVPMERLASIICDKHTQLILYYYDIMVALSTAFNGSTITETPAIKPPPPKDMN